MQAQKLESVGRLAGGVAHDFNNLLTVINGYSDMILGELPADDALHELVSEIRTAGERAAALSGQLLVLSRKQVVQAREVNLNDIIAEVEKMLGRVIGEDIRLESVLSPSLGCVLADPGQLHQILMNLAVNARDAMPGGGTLLIETTNVDLLGDFAEQHGEVEAGRYAMLSVSDTGVGMTQEVMSHLFEPFFTTKKAGEGTGLGLATVYGIVKQCGGSIRVYSEPGRGTNLRIYLPRIEPAETTRKEPVRETSDGARHGDDPGGGGSGSTAEDCGAGTARSRVQGTGSGQSAGCAGALGELRRSDSPAADRRRDAGNDGARAGMPAETAATLDGSDLHVGL